ncbi:GGDEF domain-containing protein [Franzmannia pantelleriensis]|nr:GGDEF domain-containing protein [Halomonas pantelleriensis]
MSVDPSLPQPRLGDLAALLPELTWLGSATEQDAILQRLGELLAELTGHPVALYRYHPNGQSHLIHHLASAPWGTSTATPESLAIGPDRPLRLPSDAPHWGYVRCHTVGLALETRQVLTLMLNIAGQRLRYLKSLHYERHREQLKAKRRLIISEIRQMRDAYELINRHGGHWLSLMNAQGVVMLLNDQQVASGETPSAATLLQLKSALDAMPQTRRTASVSELPNEMAAALPRSRYGDLLAVRMTVNEKTLGWLALFRLNEPPPPSVNDNSHQHAAWLASDTQIAQDLADDIGVALSVIDIMHANRKLISTNDRWKRLAHRDPLTGCWNRYRLDVALSEAMAQSAYRGDPLFLLLMDIDDFKSINDHYGHSVGDDVIVHVASLIKRCLRRQDSWGRWGGEEFMVILSGGTAEHARGMAERLRADIARTPCPTHACRITISIGVARWQPGLGHRQLIERADDAMYLAKRRGKNRVVTAEKSTSEALWGPTNPPAR